MATNLTINSHQSVLFEAPVHTITVTTGSVVITDGHDANVVEADAVYDAGDKASLSVFSPDSARISVTYADEAAPAPAERGDSGGNTGSFESRTVKELRALAKERGIKGYSKLDKDALIGALRG
jgi:hypothetical protein